MKILLINEYYNFGGAEKIIRIIKNILIKKGHDVYTLILKCDGTLEADSNLFCVERISGLDRFIQNRILIKRYRHIYERIMPDIIILNNVFSAFPSVMSSLSGYRCIQILHDHTMICPYSTCMKANGDICGGFKSADCLKECGDRRYGRIKMIAVRAFIRRNILISQKYVNAYISPSLHLSLRMESYGIHAQVLNNPVELVKSDEVSSPHKEGFVYAGLICEDKGIFDLVNIAISIGISINIYGGVLSEDDFYRLKELIEGHNNIKWHGRISHAQFMKELTKYKCMIVPSKCLENYPSTVLEAMLVKTLVIGNNIGGIAELLSDHRGVLYDYNSLDSLKKCIEAVRSMDAIQYGEITDKAYDYVITNNNIETYYDRLYHIMMNVISGGIEGGDGNEEGN